MYNKTINEVSKRSKVSGKWVIQTTMADKLHCIAEMSVLQVKLAIFKGF